MRIARIVLAALLFGATIWVLTLERPQPVQDWRADFASDTEPGELRLLFIGNSFTERNDLPRMVGELMRTQTEVKLLRSHIVAAGGAQLHEHAAREQLLIDLVDLHWTTVVLQDFSTAPLFDHDRQSSIGAITKLGRQAMDAGAEVVLFATWPRRADHAIYGQDFEGFAKPKTPSEMNSFVEAHYRGLANKLGATLAPVGGQWLVAGEVLPQVDLYAEDGYHASPTGTYLAALVIAARLGADLTKAEWSPEGVDPGAAGQLRMLVASSLK